MISLLVVLLAVISFISWWVACLIYILESILVLLNSQNIVRNVKCKDFFAFFLGEKNESKKRNVINGLSVIIF